MESREINAVLLTASKKLKVCLHLNLYELISFKIQIMVDTSELYIFITSLSQLDLN